MSPLFYKFMSKSDTSSIFGYSFFGTRFSQPPANPDYHLPTIDYGLWSNFYSHYLYHVQQSFKNSIRLLLFLGVGLQLLWVQGQPAAPRPVRPLAKFEPPPSTCLVFIGQDLEAVGGLPDYQQGYCDHFPMPSGITTYTNLSPGTQSFYLRLQGNDGLRQKANWGAGDNCAQCYVDAPNFAHTLLAIGLSMVGNEQAIARGKRDYLIRELGNWIQQSKRPVLLRIGYEFDGWDWNHYKRKPYLRAWQRIHRIFKEMDLQNVAFVWQSKGTGTAPAVLEKWYPGDALVDWCGYSYFDNSDTAMLHFARKHGKPVFIAEATPVLTRQGSFAPAQLTDTLLAPLIWQQWFVPFLQTLENHKDVIKAFSYINANWPAQPMWKDNPVFNQVDSRIQKSAVVSALWRKAMLQPQFIHAHKQVE